MYNHIEITLSKGQSRIVAEQMSGCQGLRWGDRGAPGGETAWLRMAALGSLGSGGTVLYPECGGADSPCVKTHKS